MWKNTCTIAFAGLVLLVLAVLRAWIVRDTSVVEAATRERHETARTLPLEPYLVDRANRLGGRLFSTSGDPVAGAEVAIYSARTVERAAGASDTWPAVEPELTTRTGPDGAYEVTGLAYGSKVVVFRADGFRSLQIPEVVLIDGYGVSDLGGTVAPVDEAAWVLKDEDTGAPVANVDVRLIPRTWGTEPATVRTDSFGKLAVPPKLQSMSGPPLFLVGDVPILVRAAEEASEETAPAELPVPPAAPLVVRMANVSDGAVEITMLPYGALRTGSTRITLEAKAGAITIPALRRGRYELVAVQADRAGRARIEHDGRKEHELELLPPTDLRVRVRGSDGELLEAFVAWQSKELAPVPAFECEPFAWFESVDPSRIHAWTDLEGDGHALLHAPALDGGWIYVEAAGHAATVRELARGEREVEIALQAEARIRVRAPRPYLPVAIEAGVGPPQVGRADAFGEVQARVPPGPVLARSGFEEGGRSWPRGAWANAELGEPLRLTLLDKPRRPVACVYGFVREETGEPIAKAEVYLQHGAGSPQRRETEDSGFYRFEALEPGTYAVVARRDGEREAIRLPRILVLSAADVEPERRVDFALGRGILEIALGPERAGRFVELFNDEEGRDDENRIWRTETDETGTAVIRALPIGHYGVRVVSEDGAIDVELGTHEVPAEGSFHLRLESTDAQ